MFLPGAARLSRSRCSYGKNPRAPALGLAPTHRGNKSPVAKVLTLLAACLGAVFAASVVLEAFDGDLDLCPFGAEDFTVEPHADLAIGSQPFSVFFALNPTLYFVVTAGAHLVVRYRARSALATDSPTIFIVFNMAEARWQGLNLAPALGHFFWWRGKECWW
jgi:hypothetical protein